MADKKVDFSVAYKNLTEIDQCVSDLRLAILRSDYSDIFELDECKQSVKAMKEAVLEMEDFFYRFI